MADIDRTLSQLGGDSGSVEASQIIDLSNLNFKVAQVDTKVRQETAQVTVLEQRLKDGEQYMARIERRAEHLGKFLLKQQAKVAALMIIESVVDDADLPVAAHAIANIAVQTAYGAAMAPPGLQLVGAAVGFTFSTVHEISHVIKEHELEIERVKKVVKDLDDERRELADKLMERLTEVEIKLRREIAEAVKKQKDADAEVEYATAAGVED